MKKLALTLAVVFTLGLTSCTDDKDNFFTINRYVELTNTGFEKTMSYGGKDYDFYNSGKVKIDGVEYQNTYHTRRITMIDNKLVSAYRFIRVTTTNGEVEIFVDEKILDNNNSIIVNIY